MAQYEVKFSCGHTGIIQLFGKETDRQRKISWYEKHGLCPECHRKQQEEAKKAVAEKAAAEASKFGLPELTGTPKQIAWADEIRLQIVKSINDCNNRLLDVADEAKAFGRPDVQPDIDNAIRLVDAFSQVISSEKSASKIIFYSHDWNWGTRAQAEDRVHRLGQTHDVDITDICMDDSIDWQILRCLGSKENLSDKFKHEIGSLQKKDIKDFLRGKEVKDGKDLSKQKCV